jgi:hypothetical protein
VIDGEEEKEEEEEEGGGGGGGGRSSALALNIMIWRNTLWASNNLLIIFIIEVRTAIVMGYYAFVIVLGG